MSLLISSFKPCTLDQRVLTSFNRMGNFKVMSSLSPPNHETSRRSLVALISSTPLVAIASPALALGKDLRKAAEAAKARKEKLKQAAQQMKEKGKTVQAFSTSGLDESYRTPSSAP